MKIRVAGYQMALGKDVESNAQKIIEAIDRAAEEKAEILLTPEGSLSGYTHKFDVPAVEKALERVTRHAREAGVGLALGTCFRERDGKCYNQIRFYRPDGQYLGFHSKTLCCGNMKEPSEGEVTNYAVSELRVFPWAEGLTIAGLICNDMWANPECTPMPDSHLTQRLSRMGARVIFHAVNGGRDGSEWSKVAWNYHDSNLRMRARAGKLWIVTVDNAKPEHLPCSAPSGVISPKGDWVRNARSIGADLFVHTIELEGEKS